MPGSQKFSPNFPRKPFSNLMKLLCLCLEMTSDSKNYLGCVVDGIFCHLVYLRLCPAAGHMATAEIGWIAPFLSFFKFLEPYGLAG